MVERTLGKGKVTGSIPVVGSGGDLAAHAYIIQRPRISGFHPDDVGSNPAVGSTQGASADTRPPTGPAQRGSAYPPALRAPPCEEGTAASLAHVKGWLPSSGIEQLGQLVSLIS